MNPPTASETIFNIGIGTIAAIIISLLGVLWKSISGVDKRLSELHEKHNQRETSNEVRLTKLEVTWDMMGLKAAKALHSPHTPELDELLEKLYKTYDSTYDLTMKEWKELEKMTREIEEDVTLGKGERYLAGIVNSLCDHKLIGFPKD